MSRAFSSTRRASTRGNFVARLRRVLFVLFVGVAISLSAGESNVTAVAENSSAANDALRSFLQLQEQLHNTQLALERNREETERLTARNAEAVEAKLQLIERTRERELAAMQSSNQLLLIIAASFAGIGFLAMLLTAYLQWRAVNRLAEFTALIPSGAGRTPLTAQLETNLLGDNATGQASAGLFGALSTLEKRILELEHATHAPLAAKSLPANGSDPSSHATLLLAKGESLLNLDQAAGALACYDEILATQPDHPEALVKKGVALEQLRQTDDALRCYDRAIAADGSLTVAYLQKGGLFNRLERYEEALACYEQALRAQEKARAV